MSWIREANEEPIPGYKLIRPLGSGGYGEVWLCEAPGKILKAIKFLFGNLDASASGDGRARQEFSALQRVKEVRHPFVISIERMDVVDGELAIVMELAEKSLFDVLQEARAAGQNGISRDRAIRYMSDAAEGLDFLSATHNLMHLDVKPRNLFLIGDHVKVADFGLAKHLERQSSMGTLAGISPQYAAPETFTSRITKFSDQYSLAIVYMELMSGRRPFQGKTIRELALQHMNVEPDLTALPEQDRRVVARALSKDPFQRYPTCKAFVEAFGNRPFVPPLPPSSEPSSDSLAFSQHEYDSAPRTLAVDPSHISGSLPTKPAAGGSDVIPSPASPPPVTQAQDFPFAEAIPDSDPSISLSVPDSQRVDLELPPTDGALRPTLIIGLGGFGLLAMRELRSRLTDRLGDLSQVPTIRFLYIDSDPNAATIGVAGSPDRALSPEQVFPTPLQPVTRYRRAALDLLNDWLPKEKLHSIPRTLSAQGSRALGRLAFTENYLRFVTRARRELEIASHPESLSRAADHSGLTVRDARPRVFVLAAAGGASSGALADIGYALRKLLGQLKAPPQVTSFLFMGAPADPTTPPEESANVYATLTELNHYADDGITFQSRYGGPDGPTLESKSSPFSGVYLLQRGGRGPSAAAECAERLASYLSLDLTTPIGGELDRSRSSGHQLFRSFGTGGVWFPRGLLLRSAARHVCERLIVQWQSTTSSFPPAAQEVCRRALSADGLKPERVAAEIELAVKSADSMPGDLLGGLLAGLEKKIMSAEEPSTLVGREAFDAVINIVGVKGSRDPADAVRVGRLTKSYTTASNAVGDAWAKRLGGEALGLIESPGKRVASAEVVLSRMIEFCERSESESGRSISDRARRSEEAYAHAKVSADACLLGAGFSLFRNKDQRNLRSLLSSLERYASARLDEEAHGGVVRFFRKLKAGLEDRQRDLSICRQRLTHLRRALEIPETAGASICGGPSPTVELLLPDGGQEVEWAAKRFVETIKPETMDHLDQALQALVLDPRGGLFGACQKSGDFIQDLAAPLIEQSSAYLSTLLRVTDVAEFSGGNADEWDARLRRAFDRGAPTVTGMPDNERWYLLVPDTSGGTQVGYRAAKEFPGANVVPASRSNEVTFLREIELRPQDVREAMQYCREPYQERANRPAPSPHARFDVIEWVPLDA